MNRHQTSSVTFTSLHAADATVSYHRQLRDTEKYVDLDIETAGGQNIRAHRWILEARFPVLRNLFCDSLQRQRLDLRRYPTEAVKAVIDYAYGTQLVLTEDTALKILLLSENLKCSEITNWCRSFICTRVNETNFRSVWRIGSLISDEDLMRACVPMMIAHLAEVLRDPLLLEATGARGFNCLLSDERSERVSALSRISAVAAWVHAAPTKEIQEQRTDAFPDLLSLVDCEGVSQQETIKLLLEDNIVALPAKNREALVAAMQTSMALPCTSHVAPRDGPDSGRRRDNGLLAVCNDGSTRMCMRVALQPSPCSVKLTNATLFGSAYASHDGQIYVTGGREEVGYPVLNVFYSINTTNGQRTSLSPMPNARSGHACVATESFLYVLGGCGENGKYLSSSERYNWSQCKWEVIPSMRAERENPAAVLVPGIGLLAIGGCVDLESPDEVELLKLGSDPKKAALWRRMPSTIDKRQNPVACYYRGFVYVCNTLGFELDLERLNMTKGDSKQWTRITCRFGFEEDPIHRLLPLDSALWTAGRSGVLYRIKLLKAKRGKPKSCCVSTRQQIEGISDENWITHIFEA